ncbi:hypothetical protein OGAPHI_000979 [Ogataea philodendri]|uniref:Uncharacterized protein n=1 Tax=Ogataea philodendri TaxID=1378263 RepID=A0A9P8PFE8_9ASCO|nr:uncharacterized protein OGAPHI_000979 [Ogataea philodendri]KAH3670464.1 hypothetical protein OGAPHI_000979 [Ogataea philodendri]
MGDLDLGDIIKTEQARDRRQIDALYATPKREDMMEFSDSEEIAREELRELRIQDFDHQRRFERFLALNGIKSKVVRPSVGSAEAVSLSGNSERYNLFPDSSDASDRDEDEDDVYSVRFEDNALQSLVVTEANVQDQDLFYAENHMAFPPHDDDFDEDVQVAQGTRNTIDSNTIYTSESHYPHAIIGGEDYTVPNTHKSPCPLNSNDTFQNYENRPGNKKLQSAMDFGRTDSLEFPIKSQPAQKFEDSLDIAFQGFRKMEFARPGKYKNNIVCCSARYSKVFVGIQASIYVYSLECSKLEPKRNAEAIIHTEPATTTSTHRQNATMLHFPHTINYMIIGEFKNQETLAMGCDDGRVLLYTVCELVKSLNPQNAGSNVKHSPNYEFTASSSVWGIDMYNNLVVVSDNSQSIQLHVFDDGGKHQSIQTHQILHNVPSVSFIRDEDEIYVSAASISGELVIFKFPMVYNHGPMKEGLGDFDRIRLKRPYVVSRALLGDNVWTTTYVDSSCFKEVDSVGELTGDEWMAENMIINEMLNESRILDCESDECSSSHVGLASCFHNFFIPTVALDNMHPVMQPKPFASLSDNYRRIKKVYDEYYLTNQRSKQKSHVSFNCKKYWQEKAVTAQFSNKFLLVSTALRLGLFRADKLICNATASKVFQFKPFNEDWLHSNRISLSFVIPDLNCYVAGSQSGLVSVFRLTTFRGIYGFRQEFVIPNYERLCLSGDFGVRTLIGITSQRLDRYRYMLYLVYIDGMCLSYELSNNANNQGLEVRWIM